MLMTTNMKGAEIMAKRVMPATNIEVMRLRINRNFRLMHDNMQTLNKNLFHLQKQNWKLGLKRR